MSRTTWFRGGAIVGLVVAAMLIGGIVAAGMVGGDGRTIAADAGQPSGTRVAQQTSPAGGGIADQVERAMKSAVEITGTGTGGSTTGGSGMVIDREGRILTNFHVIEGQRDLRVRFPDGSAARATVVGTDPGSDLAVIDVDVAANLLTPVTWGNSDNVRVGDAVFAIGSPFSQSFTVSSGIISATGRVTNSSFTGRSIRDVLQTDAALNPGNSGGPLFNLAGEVIGINTSIENPNGRFFVGLGFAVPSNTAQRFIPQMLEGKTVAHPQLGVAVTPLDELVASDLGIRTTRGVYVTAVTPGSAAERAGIRAAARSTVAGRPGSGGDVITSIEGQTIANFEDLARAIDKSSVSSRIQVVLVRDGQQMTVTAELQPWDVR